MLQLSNHLLTKAMKLSITMEIIVVSSLGTPGRIGTNINIGAMTFLGDMMWMFTMRIGEETKALTGDQ